MELKDVENMTKKELQDEVEKLRYKHPYGFQLADFAMQFGDEQFEKDDVYNLEEKSDKDLRKEAYNAIRDEDFSIYNWSEYMKLWEFKDETVKLLKTYSDRMY